jgi:hypothetical protein
MVDKAWEECHIAWCDKCWNRVVVGLEGLLSASLWERWFACEMVDG